jgi:phenylacetate-CoA ligase
MTVGHAAVAYWLARDARGAMRAPDLDAASLRALSAKRMRALLTDAQRSPFHAERMRAAGLSRPDALRVAELPLALQSLPPVTKHELRDAGDASLHDGRPSASWFSSRSSGSSGEPFRVYYDPRAWSMLKYLVKMRARRAAGMHLMDRVAILDAIDRGDEGRSLLERAGRLRRISVFRQPEEIAAALAAFAPAEIYALPSALLEVARACSAGAPRVRARRIFTSGELLTGAARRAITAAFGGSLSDVYGTSETKEIAWECSAGSRHINADVVHVEILDEDGALAPSGTEGDMVVTVLVNRAMPLIRYRTGDRGTLLDGRCACGRQSPLLGIVSGREADVLELTDGSTISPYLLTMALEPIAGLAQYQVVQAERDLLQVRAIADGSRDPTTLASAIVGALRGTLPCSMRVDAEVVEQLERGSRAKLRVVQPLPRARDSVASLATTAGHAP